MDHEIALRGKAPAQPRPTGDHRPARVAAAESAAFAAGAQRIKELERQVYKLRADRAYMAYMYSQVTHASDCVGWSPAADDKADRWMDEHKAGYNDRENPRTKHQERKKFLNWVADRLVMVHGDEENQDFIIKLRKLAGGK